MDQFEIKKNLWTYLRFSSENMDQGSILALFILNLYYGNYNKRQNKKFNGDIDL